MGPRVRPLTSTSVICGVLVVVLGLMVWTSICACGGGIAKKTRSIVNLKQAALGHAMYLVDWSGYGPEPPTWMDKVLPYVNDDDAFRSGHESLGKKEFGFAYYEPLGEVKEWAVKNSETVPMMFDSSDTRWNAFGGLSLLPTPPRWGETSNVVAFLDGHVRAVLSRPVFTLETEK